MVLENKLKEPLDDIILWVDGLLNSVFGAITVREIRTELFNLRNEVDKLNGVVTPLATTASIPRAWPGINLAHQYAVTLQNVVNSYTNRLPEQYADKLTTMQTRVLGQITDAATQASENGHRLKYYLRFAPLRYAPDQTTLEVNALIDPLKDAKISRNADKTLHIYANREHITWVLNELITNANRFSSRGGVNVHYDLSLEFGILNREDTLSIYVTDHGPGTSGYIYPHIFDAFYQADPKTPGIGIGLTLAKHLIELNGGELRFESNADDGTTAEIIMPIAIN